MMPYKALLICRFKGENLWKKSLTYHGSVENADEEDNNASKIRVKTGDCKKTSIDQNFDRKKNIKTLSETQIVLFSNRTY